MLKKIRSYVEKYHMLSAGDTVAAGVSGGADSVCLLLVLNELEKEIPFRLLAVHVNHMLRGDADADEAFVLALCDRLSVPCHIVREDVGALAEREGISCEEAGRMVRYRAFREILQREAADAVLAGKARMAVAHNLRDRAETMLFHLFRGTGPEGLCGMRPLRADGDGITVIRPLLDTDREEIEQYLLKRKMTWREDATNGEDDYTRNRIRHHILPFAEKEVAGGAVKNMGRAADILTDNADFVRQETLRAYETCADGESALCVERFLALHPFLQNRLILHCLEKIAPGRKDIAEKHVEETRALFVREGNRKICLPYRITARREYGRVLFERGGDEDTEPGFSPLRVCLPMPGEAPVNVLLPDGSVCEFSVFACERPEDFPKNQCTKWFDYDKIDGILKKELEIRSRRQGDYLCFDDSYAKKSIQDYMVNEKIPERERDRICLLAQGSRILWVMGYRISAYYKIDGNTKYVLQVQLRGGQ